MLLNVLGVFACIFAALVTGTYGIATQNPAYQNFTTQNNSEPTGCIFSPHSPLFEDSVKETLRPIEAVIFDCRDLEIFWPFILTLFIMNILGAVLNLISVVTDICTPCIEERYKFTHSWNIKD